MKKFVVFLVLTVLFFAATQIAFSKSINVDGKIYTKSDISQLEEYIKKNINIIPNVTPSYSEKHYPDTEYIKRLEIYKITILKIKENITLTQENANFKNELKALTKNNVTLIQENSTLKNSIEVLNKKNKDLENQIQKLQVQTSNTKEKTNSSAANIIIYVLCIVIALLFVVLITVIHIISKDSKEAIQKEMDRYEDLLEFNQKLTKQSIDDSVLIKELESKKRRLKNEIAGYEDKINVLNEEKYKLETENQNLKQITEKLTCTQLETEELASSSQPEKQESKSNGKPKILDINWK